MAKFTTIITSILLACLTIGSAYAQYPEPYQLGFQEAVTPVAERMHDLHNLLLIIITGIALFVLALLIYVVIRFNEKSNPEPSTVTHNTPLEIMWTLIPTLILLVIAFPSFKLLYYMDRVEDPEMTLKVTGYQWYWGYEYPDENIIFFTHTTMRRRVKFQDFWHFGGLRRRTY